MKIDLENCRNTGFEIIRNPFDAYPVTAILSFCYLMGFMSVFSLVGLWVEGYYTNVFFSLDDWNCLVEVSCDILVKKISILGI